MTDKPSLAERLARTPKAKPHHKVCLTCKYYESLSAKDRVAFDDWLDSGGSTPLLHEQCQLDGLAVGLSAFRGHVRACRGPR